MGVTPFGGSTPLTHTQKGKEMEDEEEFEYEDTVTFVDCTCKHKPEEHTWGACEVEDCECEGGWEE